MWFTETTDPRLIISTVGFLIVAILDIGFGCYVYSKAPRRSVGISFLLLNIAVAIFEISHAIGTVVSDPILSRNILLFNLVNLFIAVFYVHWIVAVVDKWTTYKWAIILMYVVSTVLTIFFVVHPDLFLLPSVPKMYLPNYYNPGNLDWVVRVYENVLSAIIGLGLLLYYWITTTDQVEKKRYFYVLIGSVIGFSFGGTAIPLVYNIPVDPVWATPFGLFIVPFGYSILRYNTMGIQVITKRAVTYSVIIGAATAFVALVNVGNEYIGRSLPQFPKLIFPLVSVAIVFGIMLFVWRKFQEMDVLKYEFINIVTHKFRTPITRIKWSAEHIGEGVLSESQKKDIEVIESGTEILNELVAELTTMRDAETYLYKATEVSFGTFVQKEVEVFKRLAEEKELSFFADIKVNPVVRIDEQKMKFVIQTILDNAFRYTASHNAISLTMVSDRKNVMLAVVDEGVGIPLKDQSYVFTQFFRSDKARLADTEGLGIGLYLSQSIVLHHGGKISYAPGPNDKGSVFTITLPVVT